MLYSGEKYGQPFRASNLFFYTLIISVYLLTKIIATPLPTSTQEYQDYATDNLTTISAENSTNDDLYIIRAVVYEIGVLTDTENKTNENPERHEEVNIAFYDPPHKENGLLDLDKIAASTESSTSTQDSTIEEE